MKTLKYAWLLAVCFLTISFLAASGCKQKPVKPAPDSNAVKTPVGTGQRRPIDQIAAMPDGNEIAVTVNGVDIKEKQVQDEIQKIIAPEIERIKKGTGASAANADTINMVINSYTKQLREPVLQQFIIRNLLDPKIKDANIPVTNDDVENLIKERLTAQGQSGNIEDFKKLLQEQGTNYNDIIKQIKEGLVYEKYVESQIADQVKVTVEDANKFYAENKKAFDRPEEVRASHILIKSEPNDPNEERQKAREKIQSILAQLKADANFSDLAKKHSEDPGSAKDGGDLDYFPKGVMVPPFDKAAFELSVGQISEIIETDYGFHILKVTDHKNAGIVSFEEAQKDIMKYLKSQKESEAENKYYKALIAEAKITFPKGKELKSELFQP
jgi:peptidyl-prolyl cis-trans isomerase C